MAKRTGPGLQFPLALCEDDIQGTTATAPWIEHGICKFCCRIINVSTALHLFYVSIATISVEPVMKLDQFVSWCYCLHIIFSILAVANSTWHELVGDCYWGQRGAASVCTAVGDFECGWIIVKPLHFLLSFATIVIFVGAMIVASALSTNSMSLKRLESWTSNKRFWTGKPEFMFLGASSDPEMEVVAEKKQKNRRVYYTLETSN